MLLFGIFAHPLTKIWPDPNRAKIAIILTISFDNPHTFVVSSRLCATNIAARVMKAVVKVHAGDPVTVGKCHIRHPTCIACIAMAEMFHGSND